MHCESLIVFFLNLGGRLIYSLFGKFHGNDATVIRIKNGKRLLLMLSLIVSRLLFQIEPGQSGVDNII